MTATDFIAEIFLACRAQLARAVSRIAPPQDVEDIVQQAYVRVAQYQVRGMVEEPRAFLLSVARNLALDHVKRAEFQHTSHLDAEELEAILAPGSRDEVYAAAVSNEEFGRFCDAVRQLPVQCRRVFVLKKVYGHSQQEIANQLGIAENTVEKHIAKGMALCLRYMKEQSGEKDESVRKRRRAASTAVRGRHE